MGKRGPAPGSKRSGGAAAVAHRWQGSAAISAALDRLERAIRTAGERGDIGYADAHALFMRLDRLGEMLETTIVVMAADYPADVAGE